ncbi:FAD-binding oxidoreductase [Synechococcus sp. CBW1004]|jgi:FAD/FMN-containing dehydrogenase|uniref:FAD-binding oxidoreductase n=1 Tax=Synechococcus sp. CBW1004 TaxID=1353136 RepID=UPI0018CF688D|nr:FAD-binding oxidoreductase [Synechococcus sp. CBW1004]QPN64691.1 FAD-binding oxidoreductase [Synechococcus sp. CBW1004]
MVIRSLPVLPPPVDDARIASLAEELSALSPIRQGEELARLSSDFHAYSPVLEPLLAPCRAQLAVRVHSLDALRQVVSACARHAVPLTLRGAGTGNYGQCVPLAGGLVIDLSGLRQLRQLDPISGVFTAEAGITLASLDLQLTERGRGLRLAPSTLRSSSLGGFIAGGAGGVGSLRWGFLRDAGNLLGLEVMTVEPEPRLLQLDAEASAPLNHAYGTNGILTALTLPSCAAVDWQQLVVGFMSWEAALDTLQELSHTALLLNNAALLEAPVAAALPWPSGCTPPRAGEHRLLLLAAPDAMAVLPAWLATRGGTLQWQEPQAGGRGLPLRELCWNHTTLHWRGSHPDWTYLQLLLPADPQPAMASLRQRWGEDLLWHLEAVRQDGAVRLSGLPLVRFRGVEALADLIDHCRGLGVLVFDPHECSVEDGGMGQIDPAQVAAKSAHDPAGLLNPGKLRGWLERAGQS